MQFFQEHERCNYCGYAQEQGCECEAELEKAVTEIEKGFVYFDKYQG